MCTAAISTLSYVGAFPVFLEKAGVAYTLRADAPLVLMLKAGTGSSTRENTV